MTLLDLQHRLLLDLRKLNLPVDDVDVLFRPYSKTYYGRYFPICSPMRDNEDRPKIYLYPFENTVGDLMPYEVVFKTAIHEFCHHIQYMIGHTRVKGVMHDTQFWQLYNHYMKRAQVLKLCA